MPPMLNSSATHARMSPPSPRVRKLEAVSDSKDLGHVILATLQQRVAITSLRSLFSCVGVGETEPFKLPPQHRMLVQMKTNANYFATNYLLLTVGVFAFLLMFFHPIQLLVCIVVGYGWHVFLTKKEIPTDKLEIFGRRLSEQDILLAATGCTLGLPWLRTGDLVPHAVVVYLYCSDDGLPALLRSTQRHLRLVRLVRCR